MKRNLIIFIGLIVLTLIGLGLYIATNKNTTPPSSTLQEQKGDDSNFDSSSLKYIEYSSSALQSSINNRRVLFFYANWCPTCKPADQNFKTNLDKIPEDVTLIRVNYNDSETERAEKDLSKKYGVTYQHTFVQIDHDGNVVTNWNGGKIDELLKYLK